jgi:hypothetical protein
MQAISQNPQVPPSQMGAQQMVNRSRVVVPSPAAAPKKTATSGSTLLDKLELDQSFKSSVLWIHGLGSADPAQTVCFSNPITHFNSVNHHNIFIFLDRSLVD